MMKLAILGAGSVGGTLGRRWAAKRKLRCKQTIRKCVLISSFDKLKKKLNHRHAVRQYGQGITW